jgi:cellulose synthase/poly-beta-1,6-N-acetylglucosamine synthase-like glycosyltransferase
MILVLGFYSTHAYLMLYYYWKMKRAEREGDIPKRPRFKSLKDAPMVTVQLPIFNEKYVAPRLIKSVCAMDYPKDKLEIQVLDDSTDETSFIVGQIVNEYKAQGFDIKMIRRNNRQGYKAGALQEGLAIAKGEFIAIFDADFIVPRRFLKVTIPYFNSKEKIGAVQTRWGHLNKDYSMLTLGQAVALDGHFYIEQKLRADNGYFINFNGTCGIWRKAAIYDAGGWESDTLTEDLDLSYRAQLRGWKIEFVRDMVVPGEVPVDFNGFRAQQYRWTKGAFETARKLMKPVMKSKLPLKVKYEAFVHLTNNMVFPLLFGLVMLALPVLIIKIDRPDTLRWYFLILSAFTITVFPYPIIYGITNKNLYKTKKKNNKSEPFFERFSYIFVPLFLIGGFMSLSLSNTWGIFKGIQRKPTEFTRTPKFNLVSKKDRIQSKKYVEKISPMCFIELILTFYLLVTTTYAVIASQFTLLPFLALYTMGFGYLSVASIYQTAVHRFSFIYQPEKA